MFQIVWMWGRRLGLMRIGAMLAHGPGRRLGLTRIRAGLAHRPGRRLGLMRIWAGLAHRPGRRLGLMGIWAGPAGMKTGSDDDLGRAAPPARTPHPASCMRCWRTRARLSGLVDNGSRWIGEGWEAGCVSCRPPCPAARPPPSTPGAWFIFVAGVCVQYKKWQRFRPRRIMNAMNAINPTVSTGDYDDSFG